MRVSYELSKEISDGFGKILKPENSSTPRLRKSALLRPIWENFRSLLFLAFAILRGSGVFEETIISQ